MRKASILASVVGIALVVAAVVIRWGVAPAMVKLPGNTDTTRTYSGTAATLLNPTAIATGDATHALAHDVPIVATHHDKVLKSHSGSSLVADTKTLTAAGAQLSSSTYNYAVDRKDMGRGSGFNNVAVQNGITFNFPIHTGKHDYTGWISDTSRTTTLKFSGTATRGGEHVYVFKTTAPAAPITDTQQLSTLPKTLPSAQLPALATANGISPTLLQSATAVLSQLPPNVPLAYTYQLDATYYVAPASGVVVDLVQHDVRSVGISGVSGLPTFPVADFTFTSTPASLKAAASDARDKGNKISLVESTLPLGLGIPGVIIAIAGIVMLNIRRRPEQMTLPPVETTGRTVPQPRETPTDAPTSAEQN